MKYIIVLVAVSVALVAARPQSDGDAVITRSEFDNIGIDGYNFAFETSNGIQREESANVKNLGSDVEEIQIRGKYSYVADDGETYSVSFLADANGFQPQGAHLPQ